MAGTTTVAEPVHWIGPVPSHCWHCGRLIGNIFADAKTRDGGWKHLDLLCLRVHGVGLGPNKGQMYRRQTDGRWLQVEA